MEIAIDVLTQHRPQATFVKSNKVLVMSCAFLSYTHIDDEFFGGAITGLKRSIELGVRVITGLDNFPIFQDKEDIRLGQAWRRRLDEALSSATFLIPIITPSFFNSDACRDEVAKFLDHEKKGRSSDLIMPIYFVTVPQLERKDALDADSLLSEISKRQWFDWRGHAQLSSDDPRIRQAIMSLAGQIGAAVERIGLEARTLAAADAVARVAQDVYPERQVVERQARVLWVDDRPNNNVLERRAFMEYNIDIMISISTEEALSILREQKFDAIISDMGRPPDGRAGYTLLSAIRSKGDSTPFFIYAGSREPEHTREALRRGAQGNTNHAGELLDMVLARIKGIGRNQWVD